MRNTSKKTPKDATEFEREQLRFFLTKSDVAARLSELNPSLAWLPVLAELNLIDTETQLAPWIEKNFAETDAIREVVANIRFFGRDTADVLEFRLNRTDGLRPLLMTCWRLIIRHMQLAKRGTLRDDWFDILPRIKRGERAPELLERITNVLRPKLQVGKRLSWHDEEDRSEPEQPTDLISIDYEIDDGITGEEVLAAWPEDAPVDVDDRLLGLLTNALSAALEDAIEAGVESNRGYGLSDTDVRSVAKHKQNAYRTGFLPIVRVAADLWTRLARRDPQRAFAFIELWRTSEFRLVRRLAVFACADAAVPAHIAAHVLMKLPLGELFLTSSSVEVYRLIDARWRDFSPKEQRAVEGRIGEGPPPDWFREGEAERVDRCRFDLLGHLERSGVRLGAQAQSTLNDIRERWPNWQLRPMEQAGFHIWTGEARTIVGDATKLNGVPDEQLILVAEKVEKERGFMEGDAWQALCQTDAPRALRGLAARAASGQWPATAWHSFLWTAPNGQDADSVARVAQLLLGSPNDDFSEVAADASWWLNEAAKSLDEDLLWPLWDRIAEASSQETEKAQMNDMSTRALNHPSGRLAEILLKKLAKGQGDRELPDPLRARLEELTAATGNFGRLARVRLAAELSFLFERAPRWTKEIIVPLFDWSSPEAADAWSARKYANYVGSPELIALTKRPFLELFSRADISDEDLRIFADWLVAMMLANQSERADYPISPAEARSALRRAGAKGLSSVGHRLAIEMERAKPEEKISTWRDVVGPVFQSIWPLDIELQTSASTFKLVQILRASGAAFPHAAEVIVPFIRPDDDRHHTSVYSLSDADDILYSSSPETMLDLVAAVVDEGSGRSAYGLGKVLERIREHAPPLSNSKKFQRLLGITKSN
ncbi:MAG: hypothetical protein ACREVC_06770 [Burkholderiales bacterium]